VICRFLVQARRDCVQANTAAIGTNTEEFMLVLTRKLNEQIVIKVGEQTIVVRVVEVGHDRIRLGVIAPPEVPVHREEVARRFGEWQPELDNVLK
jgi:carbon storage regulator CsrA